jgi:hypothetical protein
MHHEGLAALSLATEEIPPEANLYVFAIRLSLNKDNSNSIAADTSQLAASLRPWCFLATIGAPLIGHK